MSYDAFPETRGPAFDFEVQREPVIASVKFGDGYAQDVGDGLNAGDALGARVVWQLLTTAEKDAYVDFLAGKAGQTPFRYTIPSWGAEHSFKCDTWDEVNESYNVWTLEAVFMRVFDRND